MFIQKLGLYGLFFFCCFATAIGQRVDISVKGIVLDAETSEPIPDAIITFHAEAENGTIGKILAFSYTQQDGTFDMNLSRSRKPAWCRVRLMGYVEQIMPFAIFEQAGRHSVYLKQNATLLPEVVVLSNPIKSRGDTISYRASAFITPDTYSAEDLIKRLPGISVDAEGGISYLGESVQGVYIEGLDLVADSYQTATRSIKAEDIKSIDIMERFQQVKLLRNIKEGERAMLNIKLKNAQMLHPSGDVKVGIGQASPKVVLDAAAHAFLVNSQTQMIASLDMGNTNQPRAYGMQHAWSIPSVSVRKIMNRTLPSGTPSLLSVGHRRDGGTFNHLIRLREDATISYNLGYESQQLQRIGGQEVKLYNGSGFTAFDEQWEQKSKSRATYLSMNYTDNQDDKYVQNRLDIQGDFLCERKDLVREKSSICEEIKQGEVRLADNFSLMKKRDESIWKIHGLIQYRKSPHADLSISGDMLSYEQAVRGEECMVQTELTYGWGVGNLYDIYGNISIEGNYLDEEIASNPNRVIGKAEGGSLFCATAPTISYTTPKLKWSLSVPLELYWRNISYLNFEKKSLDYHHLRLYPGMDFKLSYRPGSFWFLRLTAGIKKQEAGNFTDFLLGSYRTSFESTITKRELIIPQKSSVGTAFHLEYKSPIQGLFARLTLSGKRNSGNNIISSILHGTMKESVLLRNERVGYNAAGQLYFSQQINSLKSLFTFLLDYNYLERPLHIMEKLQRLQIHALSVGSELNSTLTRWLELKANFHYSTTWIQSVFSPNRLDEYLFGGGLIFNSGKSFSAILYHDGLVTKQNENVYGVKSMLNAGISYRRSRYQIDLKCDNLLDEKITLIRRNRDADLYFEYAHLRPRQILLNFMLKF